MLAERTLNYLIGAQGIQSLAPNPRGSVSQAGARPIDMIEVVLGRCGGSSLFNAIQPSRQNHGKAK